MMLLFCANGCRGVFEELVDLAGDVAFWAVLGLSGGFALGGSFGDVGLGFGVVAGSGECDGVVGSVGLVVAVAVETVSGVLSRRRFCGCYAGEAGGRCFVAGLVGVWGGDVDLGGGGGADAGLVEEVWDGFFDELAYRRVGVGGFCGECVDASGEAAECLFGGAEFVQGASGEAEGGAGGDLCFGGKTAESVPRASTGAAIRRGFWVR